MGLNDLEEFKVKLEELRNKVMSKINHQSYHYVISFNTLLKINHYKYYYIMFKNLNWRIRVEKLLNVDM